MVNEMKTVIITGITGTVGKGILLSLLQKYDNIKIYGTARSEERVTQLFEEIIPNLPKNIKETIKKEKIILLPLKMDTSKVDTILEACKVIKSNETKIDALFLNAGAMITNGVSYVGLIKQFLFDIKEFPVRPKYILHDGRSMINEDISKSFCTNVYGHYIMVKELIDVLKNSNDARIIWTGSSEGEKQYFDIKDIQGINSINPYGSNKYCLYVLSDLFNQEFKNKGYSISSIVASPGVISSNIASSLLHPYIVMIFMTPTLTILRLLLNIPELTLTLENASASILAAFTEPRSDLKLKDRYDAESDRFGKSIVTYAKIDSFSQDEVEEFNSHLKKLDKLFYNN